MAWTIEFDETAARQMARLAKGDAVRIRRYLIERVAAADNPRSLGSAPQGTRFSGVWRFRVGDFRVLCQIDDGRVVVLVIGVGHRRELYR